MSEEYDPIATTSALLQEAAEAIAGPKAYEHGNMLELHLTIAAYWQTYLRTSTKLATIEVKPEDVATMMELLKIARRLHGSKKHDHYMDAAGYAAIAFAVGK